MSKNPEIEQSNDEVSFADAMQGITPLKQDKIHFGKQNSKQNKTLISNNFAEHRTKDNKPDLSRQPAFHFSEEYEPHIDQDSTLKFVREGSPNYYAKLLRRGDVRPDLILDLHGYNKEQAKYDLADLIENCKKQHIPCACIVHGVSGGTLKRKLPHYLIQHPDVLAFHQAPLEWGGQGAIVFIVNLGEELEHLLPR